MNGYVRIFLAEWEKAQKLHETDKEAARAAMKALFEVYGENWYFLSEYAESRDHGNATLNLNSGTDFLRPAETLDRIERFDISSFTVSCETTGLLEFIKEAMARGWKVEGSTKVYTMKPEYCNPKDALVFEKYN